MSARRPRWLPLLLTLLATPAAFAADPLPEGAIARLAGSEANYGNPHRLVAISGDGLLTAVAEGHIKAESPDGHSVATGSDKGEIIVNNGELTLTGLRGHTAYIAALAFSPDGKTLASGSNDRTLRLWNAASGKELHVCAGHGDQVCAVAFSPDGKTVASASWDGGVRLWDVATGKELRRCEGHKYDARAVAFAPDGKTLASGGADGTVRVWDTATAKELRRWRVNDSDVLAVAFREDGKQIVTADGFSDVRVWDAEAGKESKEEVFKKVAPLVASFNNATRCAALSPDGKLAAVGRDDGTIRLYDTATGKELRLVGRHPGNVWGVAFSPDGKTLASCARRHGAVRLWDVATGELVRSYPGHAGGVSRVAFTRDGKRLIAAGGSFEPSIIVYDTATAKELRRLEGHTNFVDAIALSPEDQSLASVAQDRTLRLWDLKTGKQRWALLGDELNVGYAAVAFSPDPSRLIATTTMSGPGVYDTATGRRRGGVEGITRWIGTSANGRTLVTATPDNFISLVEAVTGQERRRFNDGSRASDWMVFSPDGRRLLSDAGDGTAFLWDLTGGAKGGMTARECDGAWRDLGADGAAAYAALWKMVLSPKESVPLLRERLKPAKRGDATNVPRWIAQLDDDDFQLREKATESLHGVGEAARPALEKVAKEPPSAEVKRRAESVLARLDGGAPGADELRALRGLEVLEMIGTPEARAVVEGLSKGDAAARLTREAKAALLR